MGNPDLEQRMQNNAEKRTDSRRSFLNKALICGLGLISALCLAACSKPSKPPVKSYNASVQTIDIFTGNPAGGNVILNGTSKPSGGSFEVESGVINSLDVAAPGYMSAYIMGKDSGGKVIYTRDEYGPHRALLTSNTSINAYLIPADFDTVLFAQCIGNNTSGDAGDGTDQRYDHSDKTVKVGTLAYPDKPTAQTLDYDSRAAQIITDAAAGTLTINSTGEISDVLSDGCTHAVDNNSVFMGNVTVSGNTYQKSHYFTPNVDTGVSLQTIVEEMMNSASGIRWDAGGAGSPYIAEGGVIIPEGKRAIRLVNMMPLGFKFSTTGVPNVVIQYCIPDDSGNFFEPPTFGRPDRGRYSYQEIPGRPGTAVHDVLTATIKPPTT